MLSFVEIKAMNALLTDAYLPAFSAFSAAHVAPAVRQLLGDFAQCVHAILVRELHTWESLFAPLEAVSERLNHAFGTVEHLHRVCDSEALREVYGPALELVTEHASALMQNRALYAVMQRFAQSGEYAGLSRAQQTLVQHWLRDFKLGGVALEASPRERFREINQELAQLASEFEEAIMDATGAWSLHLTERAALAGLPDSALAQLRAAAEAKELPGWLLTLHYPSYSALLTYAEDRALRAEVYRAFATRASDQGPHALRFDNGPRIEKILRLRLEAAQLLGFAHAADESLATKMAASSERVMGFLQQLVERCKPAGLADLAELRAFARSELKLGELEPWDVSFVSERLKAARFGVDDESLRPYFPLSHVLNGLFAVLARVFAIRVVEASAPSTWHSDVRFFELYNAQQQRVASFYLDPYARDKKREGAWMDVCRARRREGGQLQLPVAYLVCNFAPPTSDTPALLTHDDVLTLFHEFGHGLHHMLTQIDFPGVGGIDGVEWDAIELPSQFMENFAWQREGLALLSQHWQNGASLPAAEATQLLAMRKFQAGLHLLRQLEFALFDFRLHLRSEAPGLSEVLSELEQVRDAVSVIRAPAWARFPHSFSHIFGGGYAAGYYSYLWAEVLSADAFAALLERGVFDSEVGKRFQQEILSVGGSRPALESFVAFRGREPEVAPLLSSYGLAA